MLPRVAAAWGDDARARCVACHAPKHGGDDGIGCVACHSAVGNTAERDGRLVVDTSAPISGPFADSRATPAHGARTYELLESPVLCGTCHEVTGPGLFTEPTLTEHRASPAARVGIGCASCHMPELAPAPIATGVDLARRRADHGFVGLDPPWGASAEEAARAAERSRQLLASALTLDAHARGDGIDVSLRADLAGHAIPTGASFLRRMWVDVDFSDASGTTVSALGVIELGAQPRYRGAKIALVTDADAVEARSLAPGETRTVHVVIPPAPATALVRATIRLSARAVSDEVLEALGLTSRSAEVPILVAATIEVPLSPR